MSQQQQQLPSSSQTDCSCTEVFTEMKLLKEDLTIRVSGCRGSLLLLSKAAGSDGVFIHMRLCSNHWATRWKCQECRTGTVLEGVNGRKSTSSWWRFIRDQPEATFEWVVAGNTCHFHQQNEGSFYYYAHTTEGHLQQGKKNKFHQGFQLIHTLKIWD